MFKWIHLFKNQYFGMWLMALVLFALQEVPYMIMPLFKLQTNPIMNMTESSVILDILEKVFGSVCVAVMMLIVADDMPLFSMGTGIHRIGFICAIAVLLLNYIGWGIYFSGHQSIGIMMFFIVVLPPLYYVFIGLWRNNPILFGLGIIFEAIHFTHVYGNLTI